MVRGTSFADYGKLTADPRVVFMEDRSYLDGTADYRRACGLDPVKIDRAANFTGEWRLNEAESSSMGGQGRTVPPYKIMVKQEGDQISVKSFSAVEWDDDEVADITLKLDGSDNKSTGFMNSPRVQNANWSAERDTLTILSKVTMKFGEKPPVEMKSSEVWTLQKRGQKLHIIQTSEGLTGRGPVSSLSVYDKY